jgi:hypothetical protein
MIADAPAAMAEWARLRRAVLRVATERDIRGCVLENAKRLLPLRLAALDPVISKQVAASVRRLSQPTLEGIIADVQAERSLVLATIWRMLARRFLCETSRLFYETSNNDIGARS